MRQRRVRYQPGPGGQAFGVLWTAVAFCFTLIGVFVAIPMAGLFGVLWTAVAAGMFGVGVYRYIVRRGRSDGALIIEEDTQDRPEGGDVEARLRRLDDLYARRVISKDEYEAQRAVIINSL